MKRFVLFILLLFATCGVMLAQAPKGFNYQAVVRNDAGQIVSDKNVGIRFQILQGSEDGVAVYVYTGIERTNTNGVLSLVVGKNSPQYASIDWSQGPFYLKCEIDPTGGSHYLLQTVQQILSVPYAQYAAVAESLSTTFSYNETDPLFTAWNYDYNSLNNKPTLVSQFLNDAGYVTASSLLLSVNGDTLFISGGNYIVLPNIGGGSCSGTVSWDSIIGRPTNLSQFVNDLSLNWDSIIGRPTNLSQFVNDLAINWNNIANRPFFLSQFVNDINVNWDSIVGRPTSLSDFSNDMTFAISGDTLFFGNNYVLLPHSTTGAVDWTEVLNRPTSLSDFINDLNFISTESQGLSDVIAINNAANGRITNLSDPVAPYDAVNKHYSDSLYVVLKTRTDVAVDSLHQLLAASNNQVASLNDSLSMMHNAIDSLAALLAQSQQSVDSLRSSINQIEHPSVEGALNGLFSIGNGKRVQFSQGNLQYKPRMRIFRFATRQYDVIGTGNDNVSQASTCNTWIDLFGFGTSTWEGGRIRFMPYETSGNDAEYMQGGDGNDLTGECVNADWGRYNPIINGGNQMSLWRTLTYAEWTYVLTQRANADNLKTLATVEGVAGLILLPDDWVTPSGIGLSFTSISYTINVFQESQWSQLEQAGAVFLPSAGIRQGSTTYYGTTQTGDYWTSTHTSSTQSYAIHIAAVTGASANPTACSLACSVRLVREY